MKKGVLRPAKPFDVKRCKAVGLLFLLLVIGIVEIPHLVAVGLSNVGWIQSIRAIDDNISWKERAYWPRKVLIPKAETALRFFQVAMKIDPDCRTARQGVGWAALSLGNSDLAAQTLMPLESDAVIHPRIYLDLLTSYSHNEQSKQVIDLYEKGPSPVSHSRWLTETVTLAYLNEVEKALSDADWTTAHTYLYQVLELQPGNLYANYNLWCLSRKQGDITATINYRNALIHFRFRDINPSNAHLLHYTGEVILSLMKEGLWDQKTTCEVVSFLVWRYYQEPEVEEILHLLRKYYPEDADWLFYLAELYHRRGEFQQAKMMYLKYIVEGAENEQVYLRLGVVAEGKGIQNLEEAAEWYRKYYVLAPDDILGLKNLAEVCTALEDIGIEDENCCQAAKSAPNTQFIVHSGPATLLREALSDRTNNQRIVAELLGMPVVDVGLGPNLIKNGSFEEWSEGKPEWWRWLPHFNREPFNAASFTGGAEGFLPFEGKRAARVTGFWAQHKSDKASARAGFWHWDEVEQTQRSITLTPGLPYMFSCYYRITRSSDGEATIWFSDEQDVFWTHDRGLPETEGRWYHFLAVACNHSSVEAAIRPLLRSFMVGQVVFDDVQIRQVMSLKGESIEFGNTKILVIGQNN